MFSVFLLISGSIYLSLYFAYLKPEKEKKGYVFFARAYFSDVRGLYKGAYFRVKGVEIGNVEKIEYKDNLAWVDISLRKSVPIYKNYQLLLNPLNIFGGYYLELDPGSENFPKISDNLDKQVLVGKSIADPFTTMGHLLSDNRNNIRLVIQNLKETSEKLRDKTGTLGKVLLDERAYNHFLSLLGQGKHLVRDMKVWKEMERHDENRNEWTKSVIPFGRRVILPK